MSDCRNCGAPLQGLYCHQCGQKAVASDVSIHDFLHEAADELAHLDGKILQTLRLLLFNPGALTIEHLRGRRARYVSPLRLYLTCSLFFFAIAAITPNSLASFDVKTSGITSPAEQQVAERAVEAMRGLRERMAHNVPRAMFVLMPVFALYTWILYRPAQPFYLAHLFYALHFHAFIFLMLAIAGLGSFFGDVGRLVAGLFPLTGVPYHYVALRRTFGGSRLQVAWKGTLIGSLYGLTIAAIVIAVLRMMIRKALAS